MNKTLTDLTSIILNFRDARDWKQFHTLKNMALSLSLEASEVLEIFQWKSESENTLTTSEKDSLSEELSDVLYWILLMAHDSGIDIQKAFIDKMSKNEMKYPVETSKGSSKKYTSK